MESVSLFSLMISTGISSTFPLLFLGAYVAFAVSYFVIRVWVVSAKERVMWDFCMRGQG